MFNICDDVNFGQSQLVRVFTAYGATASHSFPIKIYLFGYFVFGGNFARRTGELEWKELYLMLKVVCFYLLFVFEREPASKPSTELI